MFASLTFSPLYRPFLLFVRRHTKRLDFCWRARSPLISAYCPQEVPCAHEPYMSSVATLLLLSRLLNAIDLGG